MKDFTNNEAIEMMQRCRDEIRSLRAQVERLQPKAEAYDCITAVLQLLPKPSVVMGADVSWQLERRINELIAGEKRREAEIAMAARNAAMEAV